MQRIVLGSILAAMASIGACTADDIPQEADTDTDADADTDTDADADVPGPPWSLTLEGSGFFNNNGAPARAVMANEEGIEIARAEVPIVNGSWRVHWPDVWELDEPSYFTAVWVDNSGNEICGPNDVAYVQHLKGVTADTTILVPFVQDIDPAACIGWL